MRVVVPSILAVALAIAALACTSTPDAASWEAVYKAKRFAAPPPGQGRVYVFRGSTPRARCTVGVGERAVVLGTHAFSLWDVPAGVHPLTMVCGDARYGIQVTIADGLLLFVDATLAASASFAIVDPAAGAQEIRSRTRMAVP